MEINAIKIMFKRLPKDLVNNINQNTMNEEPMWDCILDQQQDYRQIIFQEYCDLFDKKRQQCLTHIHIVIQELRQANVDQKNSLLIQYLNLMLGQSSPLIFPEKYKSVSTRINEIIKQALSSFLAQPHQKQGDFYQATAQYNSILAKMSDFRDRQWLNLLQDPNFLKKIQLLPYFFQNNYEYKEKSYLDIPFWTRQEISSLLQIRAYYVRKLYHYYVKSTKIIDFKLQNRFNSLISTFTLAKFIVKVGNVNKHTQQELKSSYKEKSIKVTKNEQETAASSDSTSLVGQKFHFSELAMFASEKQISILPMLKKEYITSHINSIVNSTQLASKKQLIFTLRMKFHVPFRIIAQMIYNTQQVQAEKNETFFQQNLHKDMKLLEGKISYIFACQPSPTKAIQRLNLQKDFNTKVGIFWSIAHSRSDVTSCFTKATLRNFKKYYESTATQLQLESLIQPILAIKKFYFSYKELIGNTDQTEEDLISTFIIGTQGNKVVFYHISREKLAQTSFLSKLKEIITEKNRRVAQAVVLFEHQMGRPLKWHQLCQFINFIERKYHSRVYVSNRNSFCRLNITLYIYVLEFLKGFAPLITKEGFFVFVENYIKQTILLYNESHQ